MKVLYTRVSSADQNASRQRANADDYDLLMTDTCSGSIPLFERPHGKRLKEMIDTSTLSELTVHSIDRLGRSTIDVLQTWNYLTAQGITIICCNPTLRNFDQEGRPDPVSEMIVSILSIMAKFERIQIKERQAEGIAAAKAQGRLIGRKPGTTESRDKFLNKPRTKKIVKLLAKGYSYQMIKDNLGCSYSTIKKVKQMSSQHST